MEIITVKSRHVIFRFRVDGWDLNIHLIRGRERNYIVDSGLGPEMMAPVLSHIRDDGRPAILVNTHYHWDHVWGNCVLGGGMIVAHALCRDAIAEQWETMALNNSRFMRGVAGMCLPNVVFDGTLYFPGDKIKLLHTPGHTADSISVWDEGEGRPQHRRQYRRFEGRALAVPGGRDGAVPRHAVPLPGARLRYICLRT